MIDFCCCIDFNLLCVVEFVGYEAANEKGCREAS